MQGPMAEQAKEQSEVDRSMEALHIAVKRLGGLADAVSGPIPEDSAKEAKQGTDSLGGKLAVQCAETTHLAAVIDSEVDRITGSLKPFGLMS